MGWKHFIDRTGICKKGELVMKKNIWRIIGLFLMISCLMGCSKTSEEKTEVLEEMDYEALYNQFIKDEIVIEKGLTTSNEVSFELKTDENSPTLAVSQISDKNLGVIGGYIVDLDQNEIPELILSYVDNTDDNVGTLLMEIYTVIDGNIVQVESDEILEYEFFYNKCQGNLHVFLTEVDGKAYINVLKGFERSAGTLYYDVILNVYCMEDSKIVQKAFSMMLPDEDYKGQAGRMLEGMKELYGVGEWIENEFENSLGETGTNVFAPFNFQLSEKDDSVEEILRIRAARDRGIQSFQYYDYSNLRERIGLNKAYRALLEQEIIQQMGILNEEIDISVFNNMNEEYLGLVSAIEYDCNGDNISELLVFYLKQEIQNIGETELWTQKLFMDLYTQKDGQVVYMGNIDILEPVMPWNSDLTIKDIGNISIKTFSGGTYLYVERESNNEGPDLCAYHVYNLTNIESIEKSIYYMPITDAGRLNGELMIPSTINGGSSDEHEFAAKVINGEIELYYEAFRGEVDESFSKIKYSSLEEAAEQMQKELLEVGLDIAGQSKNMTNILSWNYEADIDSVIKIQDYTKIGAYVEVAEETEEEMADEDVDEVKDTETERVVAEESSDEEEESTGKTPQSESEADEVIDDKEEIVSVKMSLDEICQAVSDYYNNLNNTDAYVCFAGEAMEREYGYVITLRRKDRTEANVLVGTVSVDVNTGKAEDEWGNSWYLW